MASKIELIEIEVEGYYKSCECKYEDKAFTNWCDEQMIYDDQTLELIIKAEHLSGYSENDDITGTILEFDELNFPFKNGNMEIEEKRKLKHKLFIRWYDNKDALFLHNFTFIFDKNEIDINKEIIKTYNLYSENIKTWAGSKMDKSTKLTDINILWFLTISRLNKKSSLLPNIIDSYKRYAIQNILDEEIVSNEDMDVTRYSQEPEKDRLKKWIASSPFLTNLQDEMAKIKLDTKKIEEGFDEATIEELTKLGGGFGGSNKEFKLDLISIILTYPQRITPRLMLRANLVNNDLRQISRYITASAAIVHKIMEFNNDTNIAPFHMDWILLLPPAIINNKLVLANKDIVDVEEQKEKKRQDMIPNIDIIEKTLKDMKCKYLRKQVADDDEDVSRLIRQFFDKIFRPFHHQIYKYKSHRRVNVIIDRRNVNSKKDAIIVFDPPSDCNTIPNIYHDVPEVFNDQSRQCLIPALGHGMNTIRNELKEEEKSITAKDAVQGQVC